MLVGEERLLLASGAVSERVAAAWNRTALSWLAAGLAMVRYFGPDGFTSLPAMAGYAMICVALTAFAGAALRYWRHSVRGASRATPAGLGAVQVLLTAIAASAAAVAFVGELSEILDRS